MQVLKDRTPSSVLIKEITPSDVLKSNIRIVLKIVNSFY